MVSVTVLSRLNQFVALKKNFVGNSVFKPCNFFQPDIFSKSKTLNAIHVSITVLKRPGSGSATYVLPLMRIKILSHLCDCGLHSDAFTTSKQKNIFQVLSDFFARKTVNMQIAD